MWSSLKQLLKSNERYIIVEDGEPKYVILPYSEYQQLQNCSKDSIVGKSEIESLEDLNGEIQDIRDGGLRLEDLPF